MSSIFGGGATSNSGGGGLFGAGAQSNAGGSSPFGGLANQQSNTGGGGLFGAGNTAGSSTGGGGLFGSTNNQSGNAGTGLFGSTNNQSGNAGTGLFGSTNNPSSNTGTGLLGSTNNQSGNTATGLFGSTNNQSGNTGTGLFGSTNNQSGNTGGGGIFGASATQNQNIGGSSLFGGANQNTSNTGSSIFGNNNLNQPNNAAPSLFGGANTSQQQQTGSSIFGGTAQPQNQPQSGLRLSSFTPQTVTVGSLGHTMTHAQLQRLQFSGASTVPNEKSITKQIQTVKEKWQPALPRELDANAPNNIPTTILKTYLYNAAAKEYAPFFYPDEGKGEDEKSWEEALNQKPSMPKIDGQEISSLTYIPTICVGFKALGARVETQAKTIEEMRVRLHEMNNSLSAVMAAHQQRITVKINDARKQHEILSQRCLRLAVKVQVLRNRGYALDPHEEGLRRKLLDLQKQVDDPAFLGREDEIWARMVSLRERARWLEEEGQRLAAHTQPPGRGAAGAGAGAVAEEVLAKTRKILKDYDSQLQHLHRELDAVTHEFAAWESSRRVR